ncbi:hypothetical protein [Mycobacterium sp.]|uniref:hypothetical protein n=1 Tax=Mycobacterium sp. TaxID=1785 RepID=UPI003D102814
MTILFSNHGTATPVATDGRVLVRSATELSRLTRDRGGIDLHTVEKVFFTDGKAEPALIDAEAVADAELVGPFRVTAPLTIEARTDTASARRTDSRSNRSSLTGVALDPTAQRFTPVALAIPAETAIEFDISWEQNEF